MSIQQLDPTLFPEISTTADDPDPEITEIQSLCTNCFENVSTS